MIYPYFRYDELDRHMRAVATTIKQEFNPDVIVALSRGGMIPAQMLAYQIRLDTVRLLDIGRIGGVGATDDDVVENDAAKAIVMRAPFVVEGNFSRVLIVDDICCRGRTFDWIRQHGLSLFPGAAEIRFFAAVVRDKHINHDAEYGSTALPMVHYTCFRCEDDTYITFPWDYDYMYDNQTTNISNSVDDDEIPF